MNRRWHIFFFGRVQGVGFRATCVRTARHHEVAGWVKNLPDGSVEMVAEGQLSVLEQYVAEVCESTYGCVNDRRITKGPATGQFAEMKVEH